VSGCEAYASQARDLCGDITVATVEMSCVHEHIAGRRYCATCAVELQRRNPARLICAHCGRSAQPHKCRAWVNIRWDSGEVTRTEGAEWVTDLAGASRC